MLDMHQLFWIFPDQSVEDLTVMANLEKCVRSARHVLAQTSNPAMAAQRHPMAQSRVQSPNITAESLVTTTIPMVPRPLIRPSAGISAPSPVNPATPFPNVSVRRLPMNDTRAPADPPTSPLPLPSPTTPLPLYFRSEPPFPQVLAQQPPHQPQYQQPQYYHELRYHESSFQETPFQPDQVSIPPSNTSIPASSDSISDQTHVHAIRQYFESAAATFGTGDYVKAEPILVWVLNESDGRDFEWIDDTICMLLEVYFRMAKWNQVNDLVSQEFEGRDGVLEKLGIKFCQERRWNDVERILRYDFKGKETVMIRVARSYIGNHKWDDAKTHLVELMKFQSENSQAGLERMYILADVCWTKKDLDDARYWCLRAVQGKQTLLDKTHALFFQFISLLVRICEAQGNKIEANAFKALLASSSSGTGGILPQLTVECAEIEELCQMRPKDAIQRSKNCFKDIPLTKKQRKSLEESLGKKHGIIGASRGGGWSMLHAFATHGKTMAVQLMLEKGANVAAVDEDGNDPLNLAAAKGHRSIVSMLWDKGADPRIKNKLGHPALLSAAMGGHDEVIAVLLDRGADIETTDSDGNTTLMSAVMDGYAKIVELVLGKGADIEAKNKMGRTALMLGTLLGDAKMVELLITRGANLEASDAEGNTALLLAGGKEHVEVIEFLLAKGANIHARNNKGHTALNLAKRSGIYRTQAVLTLSIANAQNKVVSPPRSPPPYSHSKNGSQSSHSRVDSTARRSPSILSRVTQRIS
jgi:ankyrin repeat protein